MKIFLASIGSTSDIQRFLILGDFLSKKGHDVRVSSAEMYTKLAANYEVDYQPFAGDYAAIVEDERMKELIGKNPFTVGKQLKKHVYPILESSLDTFLEGAKWADVVIYGISDAFLDCPSDYPKDHYYTGFWFDANASFGKLSEAVSTFCESKKKTIVITFGSMPYQSKYEINEFVKAIRETVDVRVLIVRGWGLKDAEIEIFDDVMAVNKAPYGELFEKVDAVIHHGGAGTTALVLKSGKPQMICPVLHPVGDQYFWGKQTVKKGVGVKPITLKKLTPKQLAKSVKTLVTKDFGDNLSVVRNTILGENALENMSEIIEKYFNH